MFREFFFGRQWGARYQRVFSTNRVHFNCGISEQSTLTSPKIFHIRHQLHLYLQAFAYSVASISCDSDPEHSRISAFRDSAISPEPRTSSWYSSRMLRSAFVVFLDCWAREGTAWVVKASIDMKHIDRTTRAMAEQIVVPIPCCRMLLVCYRMSQCGRTDSYMWLQWSVSFLGVSVHRFPISDENVRSLCCYIWTIWAIYAIWALLFER